MSLLISPRLLVLFTLLLLTCSLSAQNLNRKEANAKVKELQGVIADMKTRARKDEQKLRQQRTYYDGEITKREKEIARLNGVILRFPNSPGGGTTLPPPLPGPNVGALQATIDSLEQVIVGLRKANGKLRRENTRLKKQVKDLLLEVDSLNTTIASLQQELLDLNEKYVALNDLYLIQKEMLDCLRQTAGEEQKLKDAAQAELDVARNYYQQFINSIEYPDSSIGRAKEDSLLSRIYDIYQLYEGKTFEKICGDVPYKYTVEYLSAQDHLNLATILARFPRHLLNKFGSSIDQRVARSNAALLEHISFVLGDSSSYNQRSDALILLGILPELLVAGAGIDIQDSTGTKIFVTYDKIPQAYNRKDYAKVISEYSKYQRYETDSLFLNKPEALAKVRYCVGMVLLFDLGKVSEARDLVMPGSYLARKGLAQQRATGKALLNRVVDMVPLKGQKFDRKMIRIQEDAAYGLSKNYEHQSKKPIR